MTTKQDYTQAEWSRLSQAPTMVGFYVMVADMHLTNLIKESIALSRTIQKQEAPAAAQELVAAIAADMMARGREQNEILKEKLKADKAEALRDQILAEIGEAVAVVEAKAGPAEAAGFKQWLLGAAQTVAEAAKESGFLGLGGVRVSDKEKAALDELAATLGLSASPSASQ